MLLVRAPHALRWRLETFGLYMPSLPEARPWWLVNPRAARALLGQLPSYARWLSGMQAVRVDSAAGWWQTRSSATRRYWDGWITISDSDQV